DILTRQDLPLPADHRHDTTLDRAALLIADLVESLGSTLDEVLAIGIAVPAPVDPATGSVPVSGILRGWEDLPIAEVLGRRLGAPAVVGNDADLGALGELRFGAGRGHESLLYVRASYGVGAGIILGGQVHHGHLGTAGEIGHMLLDSQGAICRCGSRGCLNTVCGAQALIDSLRHSRGPVTLTDVLDLAIEGDLGCQRVLYDAGTAIGTVAANTALALNPELIIVGGELSRAGSLLLDPMRDAIRQRVPLLQPIPLELVPAELGDEAEVRGAFALASAHAHVTTGERVA
ncbi:MAG: ROK family protein, partial [Demequina sp.]|uniref:ROK family protein n=1 Tax=Demequina sp. TaxID=2050685 RepID=UPI003A8A418D